jgi:hypothetical protein
MEKITEHWVDISFDKNYQISNTGKVRSKDREFIVKTPWGGKSIRRLKGKDLKLFNGGQGYEMVRFKFRGKNHYVHRLVAEHFCSGNFSLEINHIDGNKKNNNFLNLEFVTASENQLHRTHVLCKKAGQFTKGGGRCQM